MPTVSRSNWPVNEFSGATLSAGGLKRGSCQFPVQVGVCGSMIALFNDSLYETRVRRDEFDPSMLGSHRVFQNMRFPAKNAMLTPASRAASTFVRCGPDQYSS